mmetsp:Transcript_50859/g.144105  ORF Transcript_50859/g.144105 Transcript_50859/m.144105 type:complete len:231 (+) Transcript_50859:107-799(+)
MQCGKEGGGIFSGGPLWASQRGSELPPCAETALRRAVGSDRVAQRRTLAAKLAAKLASGGARHPMVHHRPLPPKARRRTRRPRPAAPLPRADGVRDLHEAVGEPGHGALDAGLEGRLTRQQLVELLAGRGAGAAHAVAGASGLPRCRCAPHDAAHAEGVVLPGQSAAAVADVLHAVGAAGPKVLLPDLEPELRLAGALPGIVQRLLRLFADAIPLQAQPLERVTEGQSFR